MGPHSSVSLSFQREGKGGAQKDQGYCSPQDVPPLADMMMVEKCFCSPKHPLTIGLILFSVDTDRHRWGLGKSEKWISVQKQKTNKIIQQKTLRKVRQPGGFPTTNWVAERDCTGLLVLGPGSISNEIFRSSLSHDEEWMGWGGCPHRHYTAMGLASPQGSLAASHVLLCWEFPSNGASTEGVPITPSFRKVLPRSQEEVSLV